MFEIYIAVIFSIQMWIGTLSCQYNKIPNVCATVEWPTQTARRIINVNAIH